MNIAQKRTWSSFGISSATLLISAVVIAYLRLNEIPVYEMSNPAPAIIIGLLCTVPLISIVALDKLFPGKEYDERDMLIERKANEIGIIGAFVFLSGAGLLMTVLTKMGSVKAVLIIFLVYFSVFAWVLISSVAALIQYSFNRKGGGDGNE